MVATRFKCPYFQTILAQVLLEYTVQGIPVIVHFTILDKFVHSSGQVANPPDISRYYVFPRGNKPTLGKNYHGVKIQWGVLGPIVFINGLKICILYVPNK